MKTGKYVLLGFVCLMLAGNVVKAQNDTLLIDFGSITSLPPWNNMTNPQTGSLNELINTKGISTGISIAVIDSFNSVNTNGTINPLPELGIPPSASGDSFFGNSVFFSNDLQPTGGIVLSGLNPDKSYKLSIFASRVATDNRETQYIITGQKTDTLFLNVSSNTDKLVSSEMNPDEYGNLSVLASPGPNNNNTYRFFYLGALKLIYEGEAITGTASLELLYPNGGEYWQSGKTVPVRWRAKNLIDVTIAYSVDGGSNWMTLDTVPAYVQKWDWTIPPVDSDRCQVRISSDTLSDISEAHFEMTQDSANCPIVVIGSSTAEGVGASTPDSAWVNRYRSVVYQRDTRHEVINLAKGGYTTYHLLPTGTFIPPGVGFSIDPQRNVTKALTYNPVSIIINLPSNDVNQNISKEQQLANFDSMVKAIRSAGVNAWVCTTQPRNFSNPSQIATQEAVRDSIFSIYSPFVIDFWNGVAGENGFILPELDSGDGVHLNDKGHRLLTERVLELKLDTFCQFTSALSPLKKKSLIIDAFPNPFQNEIHFHFEVLETSTLYYHLFDVTGRLLDSRVETGIQPGTQNLRWTPRLSEKMEHAMFFGQWILHGRNESHTGIHTLFRFQP